jgi:hypothetical protein
MPEIHNGKMTPYIVAGTFANGALCVTAIIAPAIEIATARATVEFVRAAGGDSELNGICAIPMDPAFLRAALQAIETGKAGGDVVSLVPKVVGAVPISDEPPRGPEVA